MNLQSILQRLAPWALPFTLLAAWQIAVETGLLSTRILPAPSAVVTAGWHLLSSGEIWTHLAISGWRAGIGFAIGGGIGLLLGFITGLSKWGERLLDSSVQMIRNVPHLALIPLVILWFGIDESAKIFLVALGTLFPDLPQHLPRHPQRRPGPGGDGAQLWLERFQPVPPGDSAGRAAIDPGGGAVCPGLHVVDPDRC